MVSGQQLLHIAGASCGYRSLTAAFPHASHAWAIWAWFKAPFAQVYVVCRLCSGSAALAASSDICPGPAAGGVFIKTIVREENPETTLVNYKENRMKPKRNKFNTWNSSAGKEARQVTRAAHLQCSAPTVKASPLTRYTDRHQNNPSTAIQHLTQHPSSGLNTSFEKALPLHQVSCGNGTFSQFPGKHDPRVKMGWIRAGGHKEVNMESTSLLSPKRSQGKTDLFPIPQRNSAVWFRISHCDRCSVKDYDQVRCPWSCNP